MASIAAPYVESGEDWLYHQYWSANLSIGGTVGLTQTVSYYDIDSKSMRKVVNGDVIVTILENKSAAHAAAYVLNTRILVKLH